MQVSLTALGTSLAQIEVSLWLMAEITREAPGQKSVKMTRILDPSILTAIVALIVAVLSPFLAYQCGMTSQIKLSERQEMRRAYADLMGLKAVFRQLTVSHQEAVILVNYYEARWKLSGAPKDGFELQEAISNVRKAEALTLEIAKTNQKLFETIGVIRMTYRDTPELVKLTDRVYNFLSPRVLGEPSKMKPEELEDWKRSAIQNLQRFVEREYSEPIEELVKYLTPQVPRDSR
jgi:hypothetical protein